MSSPGPTAPRAWEDALEVGLAELAHEGESRSGDLAVLAPYEDGALAAVIDGLGHGAAAADAAAAAALVLREHAGDAPQALFERCHRALRLTRGAVMTLAWFVLGDGPPRLRWVGVGNVEARLLRAMRPSPPPGAAMPSPPSPLILGGVVGHNLPRTIRTSELELEPGDAVAFATDGIAADYSAVLDPALGVQAQAERILAAHGKGSDDALAAVVRWRG